MPDVLAMWLLRRAMLLLRLPTIEARCDRQVVLAYVAVDLNVIMVDVAATIEIRNSDSCGLGRLTLLVENAVDGALEMVPCAPNDVVAGHRSSVRIEPGN